MNCDLCMLLALITENLKKRIERECGETLTWNPEEANLKKRIESFYISEGGAVKRIAWRISKRELKEENTWS